MVHHDATAAPLRRCLCRARTPRRTGLRYRGSMAEKHESASAAGEARRTSSVAPIARAPSSAPNRNITEKQSGAAGDITIVRPASAAPPGAPSRSRCAAPESSATTPPRDKEHHPASRKCRRESTPQTPVNTAFDQGCRRRRPRGSFAPIARAPSSLRTGISLNENRRRRRRPHHRPERVEQHRAAQAKLRRAGFLGHHPQRDKEHHPASRKCRRESTPQIFSRI